MAATSDEAIRTKTLVIRCTKAERDWFNRVAEAQGATLSDLVRWHLAEDGTRLGIAAAQAA